MRAEDQDAARIRELQMLWADAQVERDAAVARAEAAERRIADALRLMDGDWRAEGYRYALTKPAAAVGVPEERDGGTFYPDTESFIASLRSRLKPESEPVGVPEEPRDEV